MLQNDRRNQLLRVIVWSRHIIAVMMTIVNTPLTNEDLFRRVVRNSQMIDRFLIQLVVDLLISALALICASIKSRLSTAR